MIPKIVLVGAGRFGKNHLKTLMKLNDQKKIKFNGVVDSDKNTIKEIKNTLNIQVSKRVEDFLDNSDAFDVVTPPTTHYEIVKELLKNNKHVFVEKPLTIQSTHAMKLHKLSMKKKKILQVGHIFRYNTTIQKLKQILIQNNEKPYLIKGKFLQNRIQSHNTGSIFIFIHGFDILDYLIDSKPINIFAIKNLNFPKSRIEANSSINLQYDNINATLNVGWIPERMQRNIEIFTKNKRISCDLTSNTIEIFSKTIKPKIIKVNQKNEPLYLELDDFAKSIINKKKPIVNGLKGAEIVKMAELSTKSIEKKSILKY